MDDLISRQAAIDAIVNRETTTTKGTEYLDGYAKCQHDILDIINQLPSAQPERKKGKWVEVAVTDGYDKDGIKTWISVMQCDQCGFIVNAVEGHMAQYNYCPNCGADMRNSKLQYGDEDTLQGGLMSAT